MYRLDNSFVRSSFYVSVIGCGGTGGYVAEGLCRLLPPQACLVLVDPDTVEEINLRRQNFLPEEIGQFKSQALAVRLTHRYRRPIAYSTESVANMKLETPGLIVGCVDNGLARTDIANILKRQSPPYYSSDWWIDAGNGNNYGQVLIGKTYRGEAFIAEPEWVCKWLPLPTEQRPDLLREVPVVPSCADAEEQSPTINQVMASVVVEVVRRLIAGTCPWMQLYIDMETGSLTPVLATPENVKKLKLKRLRKRKRKEVNYGDQPVEGRDQLQGRQGDRGVAVA